VAVASKHVRDHPPAPRELNPAIPPTFEAIILKSMAKDPAHRYATAEELRADLLRFNEGRTVSAMTDATAMMAAGAAGATTTQALGAVDGLDATQSLAATTPGEEEVPDEEGGSHRTRTYAIILAILLIALVVAGYFLGRSLGYFGGSSSFNLPTVTGQPVARATTTLMNDGLVVKRSNQVSNDTPGTVISTEPPPNSLVKKGDSVTLKVAVPAPIPQVAVPSSIVNTTVNNAQSILQAAGLTSSVVYRPSPTVQNRTVISSDPSPGTKVPEGSSVTLTVSSGPANAIVPSLIGQSQIQAGALLQQAGLVVGGVTAETSSQYADGQIIATNPGPGASVPPGSSVSIVVSTGPPPTTTTTTTTTTTPSSSSTTSSTTSGSHSGHGGGNSQDGGG
jgi:serine/threonine-protein kinase